MPPAFDLALVQLTVEEAGRVTGAFAAWATHVELGQVCQNVAGETALAVPAFAKLLRAFAAELMGGTSPEDGWRTACRANKLRGNQIPPGPCPAVLGRAKSLKQHADGVSERIVNGIANGTADASEFLSSEEVQRALRNQSGQLHLIGLDPFLREAPLGRFNLVWATFDPVHPAADPFVQLPLSLAEIRTALGLGPLTDAESLILLWWDHAAAGSPPLHRPTAADAETYPYYRPHPDPAAHWGFTQPLPPNPHGLSPQPEVVLPDPTCAGLRLPFRVV